MEETMEGARLEVLQIDEKSWRIEDAGMVRAYLFAGEEKALLVDSTNGTGGSLHAVVEGLTDRPIMLVNTHGDPDHTAMNHEFETAWMHPAEMAHYASWSNQPERQGQPAQPKPAPLWEGDEIDIGGRVFEVVLLSGHTPGSIALLDRANRIVVTGDVVSTVPVFLFGPARDLTAYRASLERLSGLRDAFDTIYPSHGAFPLGPEVIDAHIAGAARLAAGELEPQDPPFPIPAKLYAADACAFFYA